MFYQSWKVRNELPLKKYLKDSCQFIITSIIMLISIIIMGKIIPISGFRKIVLQVITAILIYGFLNLTYIYNILNINKYKSNIKEKFIKE